MKRKSRRDYVAGLEPINVFLDPMSSLTERSAKLRKEIEHEDGELEERSPTEWC